MSPKNELEKIVRVKTETLPEWMPASFSTVVKMDKKDKDSSVEVIDSDDDMVVTVPKNNK